MIDCMWPGCSSKFIDDPEGRQHKHRHEKKKHDVKMSLFKSKPQLHSNAIVEVKPKINPNTGVEDMGGVTCIHKCNSVFANNDDLCRHYMKVHKKCPDRYVQRGGVESPLMVMKHNSGKGNNVKKAKEISVVSNKVKKSV